MTEESDLILRNVKNFSDFLLILLKQKTMSKEEIFLQLDKFLLNSDITLKSLLEKSIGEIVEIIAKNNLNDVKDFADILYIRYSSVSNFVEKKRLSEIIIKLYDFYQISTGIYIYNIESKITHIKSM
ncbi:hypothetical protein ABF173_000258 [Flavobacterium psychrophilum]